MHLADQRYFPTDALARDAAATGLPAAQFLDAGCIDPVAVRFHSSCVPVVAQHNNTPLPHCVRKVNPVHGGSHG